MKKRYRVITADFGGRHFSYSVLSDWTTYADARRRIIGRWGHWPPFAFISTSDSDLYLRRLTNCD